MLTIRGTKANAERYKRLRTFDWSSTTAQETLQLVTRMLEGASGEPDEDVKQELECRKVAEQCWLRWTEPSPIRRVWRWLGFERPDNVEALRYYKDAVSRRALEFEAADAMKSHDAWTVLRLVVLLYESSATLTLQHRLRIADPSGALLEVQGLLFSIVSAVLVEKLADYRLPLHRDSLLDLLEKTAEKLWPEGSFERLERLADVAEHRCRFDEAITLRQKALKTVEPGSPAYVSTVTALWERLEPQAGKALLHDALKVVDEEDRGHIEWMIKTPSPTAGQERSPSKLAEVC